MHSVVVVSNVSLGSLLRSSAVFTKFHITRLQQAVERIESLSALVAAVREAQTLDELTPLAKPVCLQCGLMIDDADEFLAHYRDNFAGVHRWLHHELVDTINAWASEIANNAGFMRVNAQEQGILLACVDRLAECFKVCATDCYCDNDCACEALGAAQSAIATAIVRDAVEACLPPSWRLDIDTAWSRRLEMPLSYTLIVQVVQYEHVESALTIGLGDRYANLALLPPFTRCAVMQFAKEAQDALRCLRAEHTVSV
jgi:hypothetical protein